MNTITMSATKRLAIKTLDYIKECIINDCTDEELAENLQLIHFKGNKDYINKNDYVNVEQGMAILGIKSRRKFFDIIHKYGLKNHTINNQHIGYLRHEIEKIDYILKCS